MSDNQACQATPSAELERQIMDCRIPKNEREWWAAHEIERLRQLIPAQPTPAPSDVNEAAHLRIQMGIIENLLDDPNYETSSMDMEHWDSIHDKLRDKLKEAEVDGYVEGRQDAERAAPSDVSMEVEALYALASDCGAGVVREARTHYAPVIEVRFLPGDFAAFCKRLPAAAVTKGEPLTSSYVQKVPDECDRIVWRNRYYHLPLEPTPPPAVAAEAVAPNLAVVAVVEQNNVNDDPFLALVRYQFNPVPEGGELWWSHPEPTEATILAASRTSPPSPAASAQGDEAIAALEMIYDKWENGAPCYTDCNDYVGSAFRLSEEEEDQILFLLRDTKRGSTFPRSATPNPPTDSTKEHKDGN